MFDEEMYKTDVTNLIGKLKGQLNETPMATVLSALALLQASAIIQMSGEYDEDISEETRSGREEAAREYCDLIVRHMHRLKAAIGSLDDVTIN